MHHILRSKQVFLQTVARQGRGWSTASPPSIASNTSRFFSSSSSSSGGNDQTSVHPRASLYRKTVDVSSMESSANMSTKAIDNSLDDNQLFERTVYVHPLSQIVLECLQNSHREWILSQGLDAALKLHRDGSFELRYPTDTFAATADGEPNPTKNHETTDAPNNHRIWTYYDESEKKHWLTVRRGDHLQEQFLLQDNLMSAWNNNRRSLPDRIQLAVKDMIEAVQKYDEHQYRLARLRRYPPVKPRLT